MPKQRGGRNTELSPLSLRKRYLPGRHRQPQAPHPPAVRAAAATQTEPLQAPQRLEKKTTDSTTPNRPKLTRFKDGFERETERELAQIFKRPERLFKEDKPFYPWLPQTPKVNFHLNFKF